MSDSTDDDRVVDAHVHFWDLSLDSHPWLAGEGLEPIRRDWLPADYLALAAPEGVAGIVHVEANWDPTDPLGETDWLGRVLPGLGLPACIVAFAPMADPAGADIVEAQAARPGVVGIRDILSWHPDPGKTRLPDNDRMDDPHFRRSLSLFRDLRLSFDLMVTAHQLEQATALVGAFPDTRFILNHCGAPLDRDPEGMARWRAAMTALAGAPNVSVKLSDPTAFDPGWTYESVRAVLLHLIDAFGPDRCLFGSDWPVAGLSIGFSQWVSLFRRVVAGLGREEQHAILFANAARLYRVPV